MEQRNVVSIIIPIYNAELHLNKCLLSVLNQTYGNLEVILINDGSTDLSGEICDNYAKTDNRIRVIHQKNAGPSHARNTGIKMSVGEYIQFVDSDDWIEPDMTEKLVEAMVDHVQLVICGYKNNADASFIPAINGVYQKPEFMLHFGNLYKHIIFPSPCNKLYRTAIIKEFAIRFSENMTMGEDLLFNMDYLKNCNRINIIPDQLYNYMISNNNSLTKSFNKNLFDNQQILFQNVRGFLMENNCYTGENKYYLKVIYANSIINCLTNVFHKNSDLSSKQKRKVIATIISEEYVIQNITYFKDSMQARLIGRLIQLRSTTGVYWFFRIKNSLSYRMHPLFIMLKNINQK